MKTIGQLVLALLLTPASAAAQYPSVIAVSPALEGSSIGIEVPTPGGAALVGLKWFHNDGSEVFPRVVIVEGEAGHPPDLANPGLILDDISGVSMGWGELALATPVTSSTGTAFAVFFFPAGEETTDLGEGGGPGIGLREAEEASAPFWLSSDAIEWVQFDPAYELGIQPLYASLRGGADTISQIGKKIELPEARRPAAEEAAISYVTALGTPTPNPFNPRVTIAFTLASPTEVRLSVYDVRGRLVRTVVSGHRTPGEHSAVWNGDDQQGQTVSSGVYFARFEAAGAVQVRRMVLLR